MWDVLHEPNNFTEVYCDCRMSTNRGYHAHAFVNGQLGYKATLNMPSEVTWEIKG